MEYRIRLNKYDSLTSVNKDNFVDIDLKQSTKLFPFPDVKDTIDQYEVFEKERSNCNNYRFILTINPYCSNVLFNPLTEIVKNEGSDKVEVITDLHNASDTEDARGTKNPTRNQMIMNTEYSKDSIGYEYHPGYDIFTNHILRNLTFKMVNKENNSGDINPDKWENFPLNENITKKEDVFNTIGDYMRYADGTIIKYNKRLNIEDTAKDLNKHLYLFDDLLSFTDSINMNLSEDNGWFGFVNNSTILAKERKNNKWNDINISRVLNNRKSCEFIDMYPDRSLFSFNPKYNKFKHRPEYNWNICLTYPYKNDYGHPVVRSLDGNTNALKVYKVKKTISTDGADILLFQTYTKHGLKRGDDIFIYYSNRNDKNYVKYENSVRITNVGDLNKSNDEYFFYINDMTLSEVVDIENDEFRITKIINGVESNYYIRLFKKIPNFKFRHENLTYDIGIDKDKFNEFVEENAFENGKMINFDKEQYQLAFSSTIYNDNITQITFTDNIDVEHIVDNYGKPLTDIFVTIIKNNKGYKEWYEDSDYKNDNIEYSHCFGKVTGGLKYYDGDSGNKEIKAQMSDVRLINNIGCFDSKSLKQLLDEFDDKDEITIDDDLFPGDIVEFNGNEVIENILDDVYFRFNTAQRELDISNSNYELFQYQEITADDYDEGDFTVTNYNANDINNGIVIGGITLNTRMRPEGYYYKAHYRIPIKSLGAINQSAHFEIKVKECSPIQTDGIYIKVTSTLTHGLSENDIVYICDDENDKWYETKVVYVETKNTFIINSVYEDGLNWIKLCEKINSKDKSEAFVLRRKNIDIPSYAVKVGKNKFLWRNVLNVGNRDAQDLPEYVFANGCFYLNKNINFFLKRQDGDGKSGLYCKETFPNDIYGNIKQPSNYEYKDESVVIC